MSRMKALFRFLKWSGILLLVLAVVFVGVVFARHDRTFDAPYPDSEASSESAILARGDHLVNGPTSCTGCHTNNATNLPIPERNRCPCRARPRGQPHA